MLSIAPPLLATLPKKVVFPTNDELLLCTSDTTLSYLTTVIATFESNIN